MFFCFEILELLFGMIYYSINKYQDGKKVIILFNTKIIQNIYYSLN